MNGNVILAADYPVLGVFWTVLFLVAAVTWLILLLRVVGDIFRDHSLGGLGKTAWLLCVIFLPFLGVFLYLIARGDGMRDRMSAQDEALQKMNRQSAPRTEVHDSTTRDLDELARLADLKAHGDISEAEYQQAKDKILH
ncbi:SHOCT domain-containing protein [Streptomyces sp. NPDC057428]|uniref:SHOCT domain-containing protein n=1 Tax=Streptomyces sp. NPDC057428 TaxID=3346129 RepID=UPI00369E1008